MRGFDRTGFDAQATADAVRQVCETAQQHAASCDEAAAFPLAALEEMRRTGLLGLMVPTAHGGMGGGVDDVLDAGIALGRVDMSVAMIFTMHCQQVAGIVRHASPRLAAELLPEIAAGRLYLASVTTEAGKGGHLLTSAAELATEDDRLVIDRVAPIVTGGAHADGFLITMLSPTARSPHEVSLVYAHRDQLDISVSGDWDPLGMRASHSVALKLTGQVPGHQVVGEHGQFRKVVLDTFGPLAHLGWAATWLGTAAGALSRVLHTLRSPAGRKSANLDSELLLTRLSRARQRLDTVHALLRHTAATLSRAADDGDDLSRPTYQLLVNALKITASEECHRTVEDLIDAVGLRHGYLKSSPTALERALRDLRSAALNYSNDRLHLADGRLALLDTEVSLA
ncbi:acyl-CoA dehydrogenase family protein [Streptomyces sp. DSM 15324]|uniref:acyl-CoA dehydrogenase family protein n=1 Tax=Streptomyces sp. DSM 15324 TaxID=1739111 RepID=UPI0007493CBB|nr:acyl-CoA dehydrogenase family protein [Streptomyces sp. DSM 15324]KUO06796.1 acyl-CoA dehydrogenase [Streptomyces sp. DSM 15324]